MRILLVDDDEFSREFMKKVVLKYGKCDTAVNGLEAVEGFVRALEEGIPYDIVFLDIMLPILSGVQVLKSIRKAEKDMKIKKSDGVRVVITSALYDPIQVNELSAQKFDVYFRKPINVSDIIDYMDSVHI